MNFVNVLGIFLGCSFFLAWLASHPEGPRKPPPEDPPEGFSYVVFAVACARVRACLLACARVSVCVCVRVCVCARMHDATVAVRRACACEVRCGVAWRGVARRGVL